MPKIGISTTEAAMRMKVNRGTIINWARTGKLKHSYQPYPGAWWRHNLTEIEAISKLRGGIC